MTTTQSNAFSGTVQKRYLIFIPSTFAVIMSVVYFGGYSHLGWVACNWEMLL